MTMRMMTIRACVSLGRYIRNKRWVFALWRFRHVGARRWRGKPLPGFERKHGHPRPDYDSRSRHQGSLRGDGRTSAALYAHHFHHHQVATQTLRRPSMCSVIDCL